MRDRSEHKNSLFSDRAQRGAGQHKWWFYCERHWTILTISTFKIALGQPINRGLYVVIFLIFAVGEMLLSDIDY